MSNKSKIGISLSGGGIRAMVFHAGVFKRLAEKNELENISHISSVSGGTLFTGLIFHINKYKWPTSEIYLNKVLPELEKILTGTSLQIDMVKQLLFNPLNWKFILSRAHVLSKTIKKTWGIKDTLNVLPNNPIWSLNATTGETGRRFRIKAGSFGDYLMGYADFKNFQLSEAMAISAAFPVGIGPFKIVAEKFNWDKKKSWGSEESVIDYKPKLKKYNLYDGGVYDNLGIESLFDVGEQKIKSKEKSTVDKIILSDAQSPLANRKIPHPLNPFRLNRLMSIMLDQIRSLRIRSFIQFCKVNSGLGFYYQIGSNPIESIKKYGDVESSLIKELLQEDWLGHSELKLASEYPTNLCRIKKEEFKILVRNGYETVKWNECFEIKK